MEQNCRGARVSFQRLVDARQFYGWVESYHQQQLVVRASISAPLTVGDRFSFRISGLQSDLLFNGVLRQIGTGEVAPLLGVSGSLATVLEFREQHFFFEVLGRVEAEASSGDPRFACDSGSVTLGPEEIEASLQDISPQGLGVISPVAFARDLKIPIVVFTAAGSVAVEAEVRYCRRMAEQPESFRIGLRIGELDRVGKARWNTMLRR